MQFITYIRGFYILCTAGYSSVFKVSKILPHDVHVHIWCSYSLSARVLTHTRIQTKQKKKEKKDGKRARDDRETVLDLIFTAFQQHQYYNFRDLVHKTKQPVVGHRDYPSLYGRLQGLSFLIW